MSSRGFRLAVCLGEGGSCLAGVFVLRCDEGGGVWSCNGSRLAVCWESCLARVFVLWRGKRGVMSGQGSHLAAC